VASVIENCPDLQIRRAERSYGTAADRVFRVVEIPINWFFWGVIADLVLDLVLQLDSGRLDMVGEDVVKALPLLCEVVALEHL